MTYAITVSFADAESPLVATTQLILQNRPSPADSLQLFRNGILQHSGVDYSIAGQVALPSPPPADGDVWLAFYRY